MLIARTKQDDLNLLNFCLHHVPLFLICFLFLSLNVAYMKQRYKILKKQALGDRQSFSNSPLILRRFANRVSIEISFGRRAEARRYRGYRERQEHRTGMCHRSLVYTHVVTRPITRAVVVIVLTNGRRRRCRRRRRRRRRSASC